MSEYRTPEEDTIGGHAGEGEQSEGSGPPSEGGEPQADSPERDEQPTENPEAEA